MKDVWVKLDDHQAFMLESFPVNGKVDKVIKKVYSEFGERRRNAEIHFKGEYLRPDRVAPYDTSFDIPIEIRSHKAVSQPTPGMYYY